MEITWQQFRPKQLAYIDTFQELVNNVTRTYQEYKYCHKQYTHQYYKVKQQVYEETQQQREKTRYMLRVQETQQQHIISQQHNNKTSQQYPRAKLNQEYKEARELFEIAKQKYMTAKAIKDLTTQRFFEDSDEVVQAYNEANREEAKMYYAIRHGREKYIQLLQAKLQHDKAIVFVPLDKLPFPQQVLQQYFDAMKVYEQKQQRHEETQQPFEKIKQHSDEAQLLLLRALQSKYGHVGSVL